MLCHSVHEHSSKQAGHSLHRGFIELQTTLLVEELRTRDESFVKKLIVVNVTEHRWWPQQAIHSTTKAKQTTARSFLAPEEFDNSGAVLLSSQMEGQAAERNIIAGCRWRMHDPE